MTSAERTLIIQKLAETQRLDFLDLAESIRATPVLLRLPYLAIQRKKEL